MTRDDDDEKQGPIPEWAYALVSDLTRAYQLQRLLGDIVPGHDISQEEIHLVGRTVHDWIERMHKRLRPQRPEDD